MSESERKVRNRVKPYATPLQRGRGSGDGGPTPRRSGATSQETASSGSGETERLNALYNTSFTMHSVTALFRVDTSAAALDGYGRALATFARRQLDPASVGEAALDARAQKTSGVTATIAPYPLAALSDDAPTPLLIRVVVPATGKRTRGDAPALLALLLASTPTAPDTQSAGFIHWPLLLVRATPVLGEALRSWLQHTFDCRISQLRLKPHEVADLAVASVASWMDGAGTGSSAPWPGPARVLAHLSTSTRAIAEASSDKLRQMVVTVAANELKRLAREHGRNSTAAGGQADTELLDNIHAHVSRALGINLDAFSLLRFGTGAAYLSAEGKIKLFGTGPVPATLDLLTALVALAQRRCGR